jgi:hypothetical protein
LREAPVALVIVETFATFSFPSRRLCRRFRNDSEAVGLGKVCVERTSIAECSIDVEPMPCAQDAIRGKPAGASPGQFPLSHSDGTLVEHRHFSVRAVFPVTTNSSGY